MFRHRLIMTTFATIVLSSGLAGAKALTEDFTATTHKDTINTTADWNTAAGELRLFPFAPSLLGTYNTTGMARDVVVSGNTAFVADQVDGLQVIDISDPTNPTLLGSFNTSGSALGIAVAGHLVYIADSASGVQIIDVSDPTNPLLVGTYDTSGFASDIVVAGDHAYVADVNGGLAVINIANPAFPSLVGSYDTPDVAHGIAVDGDYAFIADEDLGLRVVDISDPTNPVSAGSLDTAGRALRIAVDGDYAFIADSGGGLCVINIADPTSPSLISTYNTPDLAYDVAVVGDRAFVADDNTGLLILDITNPASPVLIDTYDTTGSARGVAVDGTHAFVAGDASGLQVIQVAASMDPALTSTIALSGGPGDVRAWGIDVAGNYAFVADDAGGGLQIIDISDPAAPFVAGNYNSSGLARGIAVDGNFAYLADGFAGLTVVDISDPTTPTFVGSHNTPGFARRVAVTGDYAYVADESGGGLRVIDVSDPTTPTLVGTLTTINPHDIVLAGEHAYLADFSGGGLQVVDISDAANPTLVATTSSGSSEGLAAAGEYVFVAGSNLLIFDVSDPANPVPVDTVAINGSDAAVVGDRVIVGGGDLHVIDISDPANAVLLPSINTTHGIKNVVTNGQFVFGAADAGGLTIGQIFQDEVIATSGVGRSLELDDGSDAILRARISSTQTAGVDWELSANGGADFETFSPGVWTPFTNLGADLRWRSIHTWELGLNPTVSSLTVDWLHEFAPITSITDVPNDQGGRAYVGLTRSGYDFTDEPSSPVTQYGVYRRVDSPALQAQILSETSLNLEPLAETQDDGLLLPGIESAWINGTQYVVGATAAADTFPPGTWALIVTVPATQSDGYLAEVTTEADSSATGTNHSVFVVTTHTTTPSVWFVSAPDSGYSVDNIAPSVPQNLVAAYNTGSGNQLTWNPNAESDLQYYRVYRDTNPNFTPSPGNFVEGTASPSWTDTENDGGGVHYKITAVDDADNESDPASPGTVTSAPETAIPETFVLYQNVPNPFNPTTTIRYDVASGGGKVTLQIFDVSGRLVRTLVDGNQNEGRRSVTWDGRNNTGQPVVTGTYFYRLTGPGFSHTRKMLLLK